MRKSVEELKAINIFIDVKFDIKFFLFNLLLLTKITFK